MDSFPAQRQSSDEGKRYSAMRQPLSQKLATLRLEALRLAEARGASNAGGPGGSICTCSG